MMRLHRRRADFPDGRGEKGAAGSHGREAQTNLGEAKKSRGEKESLLLPPLCPKRPILHF